MFRYAAIGVLFGAAAFASGCAATFRCPGQGGPSWRELTSEHFSLSTDLDSGEAREAVQDLEDFRALLIATAWPRVVVPGGRLRVVIVSRERDWRAFEESRDGFYTEALFQPFIALRAGGSDQTRLRIRHELTHHLSRFYVEKQPEWLAEGLATFFETLAYDCSSGEVLVGLPQPGHLQLLAQQGPLRVAEALDGSLKEQDTLVFYALSWLMVHYFISREREDFTRYMRGLDSGLPHDQAWRRAFPDLDPETLRAELRGYARNGGAKVISRRFPAPDFAVEERPLPDADVHALRALLYMRGLAAEALPQARAEARRELAEAFRLDPNNVLAHAVRDFALADPADLPAAQRLTADLPDSWLAWMSLYRAAGGDLTRPLSRRAAVNAARLAAPNPSIKLPFGPEKGLFAGVDPALRACPAQPLATRVRGQPLSLVESARQAAHSPPTTPSPSCAPSSPPTSPGASSSSRPGNHCRSRSTSTSAAKPAPSASIAPPPTRPSTPA